MKQKISIIILLGGLIATTLSYAVMSGGPFSIPVLFTTNGGGNKPSAGTYLLNGSSVGALIGDQMEGGDYTVTTGVDITPPASPLPKDSVHGAYAYPVPFKPSLGHTTITFNNLPAQAEIYIYTLTGELVKTIEKSSDTPDIVWDVKNDNGRKLASGVYIFIIKGKGAVKKGKLAIIK